MAGHRCANLRLPTSGGFYAWELEKGGPEVWVGVERQLPFNNPATVARDTSVRILFVDGA